MFEMNALAGIRPLGGLDKILAKERFPGLRGLIELGRVAQPSRPFC